MMCGAIDSAGCWFGCAVVVVLWRSVQCRTDEGRLGVAGLVHRAPGAGAVELGAGGGRAELVAESRVADASGRAGGACGGRCTPLAVADV